MVEPPEVVIGPEVVEPLPLAVVEPFPEGSEVEDIGGGVEEPLPLAVVEPFPEGSEVDIGPAVEEPLLDGVVLPMGFEVLLMGPEVDEPLLPPVVDDPLAGVSVVLSPPAGGPGRRRLLPGPEGPAGPPVVEPLPPDGSLVLLIGGGVGPLPPVVDEPLEGSEVLIGLEVEEPLLDGVVEEPLPPAAVVLPFPEGSEVDIGGGVEDPFPPGEVDIGFIDVDISGSGTVQPEVASTVMYPSGTSSITALDLMISCINESQSEVSTLL